MTDFSDIFVPLPHFPVDMRQAAFGAWLEGQVAKHGNAINTIPMTGFPASAVNLGWLQDQIFVAWTTSATQTHSDVLLLQSCVKRQLPLAVQRLKDLSVQLHSADGKSLRTSPVNLPLDLGISFTTKDDWGWYEYSFYVRLIDTASGVSGLDL